MTALPPGAARALAVRLLEGRGFSVSGRNGRGDSAYLSPPGTTQALRVSNHARTGKQRRTHREVLTSLVLAQPRTPAQVHALVEAALRNFAAEAARRISSDDAGPG